MNLGLILSTSCPGLLLTSANDGNIKVWDIIKHEEPLCIWEKKTKLGALLCVASNPDNPFIFSAGGDNKSHNFQVFDFSKVTESKFYCVNVFIHVYLTVLDFYVT